MTQPPPYQGGYPPQQPPQQPGQGQPQQPGYGQQPGQGQPQQPGYQPGYDNTQQTPSGFPPPGAPGAPPPPPGGGGVGGAAKSAGKGLLIRLGVAAAVIVLLLVGGWVVSVLTGDTSVAAVGDCTNQTADTSSDDASDVKTVDCNSEEAFFKIVARTDDPSSNDHVAVADEVCAGTDAAEYIYYERGTTLEWIICLDPINITTPKWGELPQAGECMSDSSDYMEIVDCSAPEASYEVTASSTDAAQVGDDDLIAEFCQPTGAETYYAGPEAFAPYEWAICVKTP